ARGSAATGWRARSARAPGYSCGYDLRPSVARAMQDRARASGLRLATHAATTSGPRSPVRCRTTPGPPVCAWLLMRLRPPALGRPCDAGPRPGLRSAPGYSCGYDLRPSIARAMQDHARASGLRLATHAATTSGPRSPVRCRTTPGPPVCAWLLMRLRPPALDRPCDAGPRPGLRSAPGYSCGYDLRPSIARAMQDHARASGLRLATHAATTSGPRSP